MFFALMSDKELCRQLLELILDKKIDSVSAHREKSFIYHPKYHGVRLDIIVIEEGSKRKFNVEMQAMKKDSLPKRTRYYHSQIDMDLIRTGEDYDNLTETYVIFICDFDPFQDGLYRYCFEMQCQENGRKLSDGTYTIFLNSHGNVEDKNVSEELAAFLRYVADPESAKDMTDEFVGVLDQRVQKIRVDREWEAQYMLLEETLKEEKKAGREEGRIEGRKKGREEGIIEGRIINQINIVLKKIKRNIPLESILEDFDEPEEIILIYNMILKLNEFENIDRIFDEVKKSI